MATINPHMNFNGNAEEAFTFYKSVFGGEFNQIMHFKDMPAGEQQMPSEEAKRIMHISLPIGENYLMGSDISKSMGMKLNQGNNNYISLSPDTVDDGRELFNKLSDGGKVEMPFEKMFWGDYFASFTDKFGVMWMVNVSDKK